MSEAVKETQCATCLHKEVCSLKAEFLRVSGLVKTELDWVRIEVKCKHYAGKLQSYRDITAPSVTDRKCPYTSVGCIHKGLWDICNSPSAFCPYDMPTSAITTHVTNTKGDLSL